MITKLLLTTVVLAGVTVSPLVFSSPNNGFKELSAHEASFIRGGADCWKPKTTDTGCGLSVTIGNTTYTCASAVKYTVEPTPNVPGANVQLYYLGYCYAPGTTIACGQYTTGYRDCGGKDHKGKLPPVDIGFE